MDIKKIFSDGSALQGKILGGIFAFGLLGNLLIWTQSDFMKSPHEAPPFFGVLISIVLFGVATRASHYRGTMRSLATLFMHESLNLCLCSTVHYFDKDTKAANMMSSQSTKTHATDEQLNTIKAGAVITMMAGFLAVFAGYANHQQFSKVHMIASMKSGQGPLAIVVALFLFIGSALLWSIKKLCTKVFVNKVGPFITTIVLMISALTNDSEARDLSFVYLMSGWVTFRPILEKLATDKQDNANDIYKAAISFLYMAVIIFTLGTLALGIKRRGIKMIQIMENIILVGAVAATSVVTIIGASMIWSKHKDNNSSHENNYFSALSLFVCIFQIPAVVFQMESLTMLNFLLVPLVVNWSYPAIFGTVTGTVRAGMMLVTIGVVAAVLIPILYRSFFSKANAGKKGDSDCERDEKKDGEDDSAKPKVANRQFFIVGVVLVVSAWLALTETNSSSSSSKSSGGGGSGGSGSSSGSPSGPQPASSPTHHGPPAGPSQHGGNGPAPAGPRARAQELQSTTTHTSTTTTTQQSGGSSSGSGSGSGKKSSSSSNSAKLKMTSWTGYIGALLGLSYGARYQDGLKIAFYLTGAIFMSAWPWALGYQSIEDTSTIITFFALLYFIYLYLSEVGDAPFEALEADAQEGALEESLFKKAEEVEAKL